MPSRLSRRLRIPVVVALAFCVLASVAVPAASDHGRLHVWRAKVIDVEDGDTFEAMVDTDGNGSFETLQRIRMIGIQALELETYSDNNLTGACHSVEAEGRLRKLIEGKRVKLSAMYADSTGTRGRPSRYVAVKINGRWRDVGKMLSREGHVLWSANGKEWKRNAAYAIAVKRARAERLRLWNPDFRKGRCNYGPQQRADLDMWIQWDADGADKLNVNGEWVRIANRSTFDVRLDGWNLRDETLDGATATNKLSGYLFPSGTTVPAGGAITVHVGTGTNVPGERYYMGYSYPKFQNVKYARGIGDGAFLFDPDGDMRASFMYPCFPRTSCGDWLRDKVTVKAEYDPKDVPDDVGEYIDIKNVHTAAVHLEGYQLDVYPRKYAFAPQDVLQPGETLRLFVASQSLAEGKPGDITRYWNQPTRILNNSGHYARLATFEDVSVACHTWGGVACGKEGS